MVIENLKTMEEPQEKLIVQRRGGGSIIEKCPVFSHDAETLYVVWGPTIRAYSVKTGELVRDYGGMDGDAVGFHLHPKNNTTIVACSNRGILYQWHYRTGRPEKSVVLYPDGEEGMRVVDFYGPITNKGNSKKYLVCIVWKKPMKEHKNISICKNHNGKPVQKVNFEVDDHPHSIAFGGKPGDGFMAAIYKNNLQFCDTVDWKKCDKKHIGKGRKFTCVACHPEERCIATGDSTGRVLLWWNLLSSGSPTYAIYHWHTLPCQTIAFSHTGNYFFSGADECVLVKWTVNEPDKKSFLPRLQAGICHLVTAPENKYIAISTRDNSIKIATPQMRLNSAVQHFTWSIESRQGLQMFPAGIIFDPHTRSLVTNGKTGHIQFYSPRTKSLLYNLDITGMNYLTQERNATIVNTDVTKIALNSDGHWMATVEHRDDGETNMEIRLKFWQFNDQKQTFCLNTSVELPHNGAVVALSFQPSQDPQQQLLVTTGKDFKFRTWVLVESSNIYKKGVVVWRCESMGFYRSLPVGDISFSMDGSLLAVAFGPTLTVWVPETNELKCSLTPAKANSDLRHVEFGHTDCYHLVVTCTEDSLNVWNLLTLRLQWTVPLHISILTADPCSEFMAVFTTNSDLFVFSPRKSKPVHVQKKIVVSSKVISSAFIPYTGDKPYDRVAWQDLSQLYILNSKQELLTLDRHKADIEEKEGLMLPSTPLQTITPFGALLAKKTISDVEKKQLNTQQQLGVPGDAAVQELLSTSAHTMAPVNLLCGPFLRSLVASDTKKSQQKGSSGRKDKEEEYERMETEDSGVDSGDETSGTEMLKKPKNTEIPTIKATDPNKTEISELETRLTKILKEELDWVLGIND